MISIVSPIYNEEKILSGKQEVFRKLSSQAELIFVDGGSTDRSLEIAVQCGGKALRSAKGRALQMNYGARQAATDVLFFLHADNTVLPETLSSIEGAMRESKVVGGCLTQSIGKSGLAYRTIEAEGNLRARVSRIFYGDQGIFVKKDTFMNLGGFPEVPIMEDVLFSRKLRKEGKTAVLPDKIIVSARRWEKRGIIRTILIYNLILVLFRLGYPLEKIKMLYGDLR